MRRGSVKRRSGADEGTREPAEESARVGRDSSRTVAGVCSTTANNSAGGSCQRLMRLLDSEGQDCGVADRSNAVAGLGRDSHVICSSRRGLVGRRPVIPEVVLRVAGRGAERGDQREQGTQREPLQPRTTAEGASQTTQGEGAREQDGQYQAIIAGPGDQAFP